MAPTPYHRSFSFTGSVSANPNFVPAAYGSANDSELDQIAAVTGAIITALGLIQRSDGALQNGIVTLDSLAPAILLTFQDDIAASAANAAAAANSANGAAAAVGAAAASAASAASSAAGAASAVTNAAANAVAAASASATAAAGSASNASNSAAAAAASAAEASAVAIPPGSITGDKLAAGAVTVSKLGSGIDVGTFAFTASGGAARSAAAKLGDVVSAADFPNIGAAVVACNANGRTLYVPAGNWPLPPNLTVQCHIRLEAGALLMVPANASLVITGHFDAPMGYCIAYADPATSKVSFPRETATPRVPVEWFGARGPDAAHGGIYMQRAIEACRQTSIYPGPTVYFSSNTYQLGGSGITLYPTTPVFAEPGAHLEGSGPTDNTTGIYITEGNYSGFKMVLPSVASCQTGVFLERSSLANVEIPYIQNVTNGLSMSAAGVSAAAVCLDNKVVCQYIQGYQQNAILISCSRNGDTFQGNEIYVNFITGGFRAVLFFGNNNAAPNWDSNKIIIQAVDCNNVSGSTGLAVVAGGGVARLKFAVETWFGGIPDDGSFVIGQFYFSEFYFGLNDRIKSYSRMQISGQGNKIATMDHGDDLAGFNMYNSSPATGSFNGGVPVDTTGFSVSTAPPTTIAAGGTYTAYGYSPYIQTHSNFPRVSAIVANGWVVDSVATSAVANEFAVRFRNVTGGGNSMPSTWRVECGG